jgi:DNA invertase Pin-like site-specific DNA recombinase
MIQSSRTRTVAYLRVSTEKQVEKGVSLEAQRAKVDAYAALYDLDLVEVIVDAGATAKSLDRDGLQRALNMLHKKHVDALLVTGLSRLTRSVRDLGELVERYFAPGKAALLSVGEQIDTRSAAGRLVLNVLASVSQRGFRARSDDLDGDRCGRLWSAANGSLGAFAWS